MYFSQTAEVQWDFLGKSAHILFKNREVSSVIFYRFSEIKFHKIPFVTI
ncbi:Uncharacterized protein dnm_023050 [Desulfonema magnum]|uniref:Uncharacterized protein n=1 Tax=Desulfonema magnum TaxID=45655 RepID=A0A975BIF9_9BACT|nr:Uncharacterized protein dnm_023050 [Desulfonema magnum]